MCLHRAGFIFGRAWSSFRWCGGSFRTEEKRKKALHRVSEAGVWCLLEGKFVIVKNENMGLSFYKRRKAFHKEFYFLSPFTEGSPRRSFLRVCAWTLEQSSHTSPIRTGIMNSSVRRPCVPGLKSRCASLVCVSTYATLTIFHICTMFLWIPFCSCSEWPLWWKSKGGGGHVSVLVVSFLCM